MTNQNDSSFYLFTFHVLDLLLRVVIKLNQVNFLLLSPAGIFYERVGMFYPSRFALSCTMRERRESMMNKLRSWMRAQHLNERFLPSDIFLLVLISHFPQRNKFMKAPWKLQNKVCENIYSSWLESRVSMENFMNCFCVSAGNEANFVCRWINILH